MTAQFELTADDYADAQRTHLRKMLGWKIAFAYLFVIIFILGIIISVFDSRYLEQMKPLWFLAALATLLVALTETGVLYRRQFRKLQVLQVPVTMEVDHDSIFLSSERGEGRTKWSSYEKWQESRRVFLLYTQPKLFYVVPKHALGPEKTDVFRQLLQEKIRR